MEALMWISRCERPLGSQELCHALGVELGAEDLSTQNVPSMDTILGCTLGLVIIDQKASTPRLLHLTLQEYLEQYPILPVTAHSMMAEICLTYLNSRSVRALPPDLGNALKTTPFLKYATCFWGAHAARGVTEPVKSLALRLLDGYEDHVSAAVLWAEKIREWDWVVDVQGISGLHCIAFWGIEEIAIAILETGRWGVNERDSRGHPPLMWAVRYGNDKAVELLLEKWYIEADMVVEDGRIVLSFAAASGNGYIVNLLLEHGDVNPDSLDDNPDSLDDDGRTPLSFAAEEGMQNVVRILLEHGDVDPNSSDDGGRTPLSYAAAAEGALGVVRLLLKRGDVDPDLLDNDGRTPLSFAAAEKAQSIVNLLLKHEDVNADSSDKDGRTPLSFAVSGGALAVAKLLLERGSVDINSLDGNGRTPLSYAAQVGTPSLVKLLLEREDVDADLSDDDGRTPLSYAAERGGQTVVEQLLECENVNLDSPDDDGRTPLSFAAAEGAQGVVKLSLKAGMLIPICRMTVAEHPCHMLPRRGHWVW